MSGIDRRTFLKGAAAGTAGLWVATNAGIRWASASHGWSPYQSDPAAFPYGVASGDPRPHSVVIWTHVAASGSAQVGWRVAEDPAFANVVAAGARSTDASRDHTVKIDVGSGGDSGPPLDPAKTYFYQFSHDGTFSRVGRTRTAPPADPSRPTPSLSFALVSCQEFQSGFYAAWRHIAKRGDLDFVLQVGDYIYEGGRTSDPIHPDRVHHPDHEIVSLGDYRRRYRNYRSDEDLKAAHAAHPFIVTMDDHEVANNSWREGAQNHTSGDPDEEEFGVDYTTRRADAFQVYREWMPIRLPEGRSGADMRIYRSLSFGSLLDLFVLDTRQYRDEQANDGPFPVPGPQTDDRIDDPNRTYLGDDQRRWLEEELLASKKADTRWRILGNQAMLAQFTYGTWPDEAGRAMQELIGMPPDGYTVNPDQWDGYQAEQKEVLEFLADIPNVVVCTGDIHMSFANEVYADEGKFRVETPVAAEFIGPSISSGNFDESVADQTGTPVQPRTTSLAIEQLVKAGNPHIRYMEADSNGYVVVRVSPDRVRGEWYHLASDSERVAVRDPQADEVLATAWEVDSGDMRLRWVGGELVAT